MSKEAHSSDETARFADDLIAPDTQTLTPEESAAVAALPKASESPNAALTMCRIMSIPVPKSVLL